MKKRIVLSVLLCCSLMMTACGKSNDTENLVEKRLAEQSEDLNEQTKTVANDDSTTSSETTIETSTEESTETSTEASEQAKTDSMTVEEMVEQYKDITGSKLVRLVLKQYKMPKSIHVKAKIVMSEDEEQSMGVDMYLMDGNFRQDAIIKVPDTDVTMTAATIYDNNSKMLYNFDVNGIEGKKMKVASIDQALDFNPASMNLDVFLGGDAASIVSEAKLEKLNGEDVLFVEVNMPDDQIDETFPVKNIKVWYSLKASYPVKMLMSDTSGLALISYEFSEIEINGDYTSMFELPADVEFTEIGAASEN